MANVFDTPLLAISEQKLHHITSREPVCKTCNHDPLNVVTELIRAVDTGEIDSTELDNTIKIFTEQSVQVAESVASAGKLCSQVRTSRLDAKGARLIPVVSAV